MWLLTLVTNGVRFVPFAAAACLFGWLARRWSVRAAWPLAGFAVLGLIAGQMHAIIQVPDSHVPHGQVMVGFGLNLMQWVTHLPQVAVPIAVGMALVLRRRSRTVA
jgi:uncharacterized membrane protein AbrB (regulator of aidB expression)